MTDITFIPGKWYAFTGSHTGTRPEGAPAFVARYKSNLPMDNTILVFDSTLKPTAGRHLIPCLSDCGFPQRAFLKNSEVVKFKIQLLEDVEGDPVEVR